MVSVPHLKVETGRNLVLGLIPGKHGLLLGDDNLLLCNQVVEGIDEAPVEVALSCQGVVVHVRVLLVLLLPFQPAGREVRGYTERSRVRVVRDALTYLVKVQRR